MYSKEDWVEFPEKGYLNFFTPQDLEFLLSKFIERNVETTFLDFKREEIRPRDLADTICAMANTKSGLIIIGIDPKNEDPWKGVSNVDNWQNKISMIQRDLLKPPLVKLETVVVKIKNKDLLLIFIPKVEEGIFTKNSFYYRIGSTNNRAEELEEIEKKQSEKRKQRMDILFLTF